MLSKKFVKTSSMKAILILVAWVNLYPHFPHLVPSLGDLRITFLAICNFHDNGLRVDLLVLWEYYIELLRSLYPETVYQFENKEREREREREWERDGTAPQSRTFALLFSSCSPYLLIAKPVIKQGCQSSCNVISTLQTFISVSNCF